MGQAQNLAKGRAGTAKIWDGTGRDSQNPGRDTGQNGTEVSSLSRDKGTMGQAQNLAKGRDGPGQLKSGTGRAGTAKIRDGMRDKIGQSRKRKLTDA